MQLIGCFNMDSSMRALLVACTMVVYSKNDHSLVASES